MIMNMLEKRAFLKVLVVLGWEHGWGDTPLASHSVGIHWSWHPIREQTPSPLMAASPCSWQRYPYLNAPLQVGLVGLW